ncbi:MAG: sigma-70 family RNA polymerase sigma factor [Thermotogae bacterium]|nr:sigma-70 family RNA polymerase sigma factor [Thermotogota bacterium]
MVNDLVSRLKRKDIKAFNELYDKYSGMVASVAYSYLGSADEVEDVIQETFLRVYKGIKRFKGDALLSTWIYKIAINVCKDMLNRRKRKAVELMDSQEMLDWMHYNTAEERHLDDLRTEELKKVLSKALNMLSNEDRMLITLRDVDALSYEEIGKRLGKPVGTVKSRLFYARKRLKGIMENLMGITATKAPGTSL